MSDLPFILFISMLLPVGFMIGYATHALVVIVNRTRVGTSSLSA